MGLSEIQTEIFKIKSWNTQNITIVKKKGLKLHDVL